MTALTATAAILVLFDGTAFPAIVIPFRSEITLMTGGAEGLVYIRGVYKWSRHDFTVAAATAWVNFVVARVVPFRLMAKGGWCPAVY